MEKLGEFRWRTGGHSVPTCLSFLGLWALPDMEKLGLVPTCLRFWGLWALPDGDKLGLVPTCLRFPGL